MLTPAGRSNEKKESEREEEKGVGGAVNTRHYLLFAGEVCKAGRRKGRRRWSPEIRRMKEFSKVAAEGLMKKEETVIGFLEEYKLYQIYG